MNNEPRKKRSYKLMIEKDYIEIKGLQAMGLTAKEIHERTGRGSMVRHLVRNTNSFEEYKEQVAKMPRADKKPINVKQIEVTQHDNPIEIVHINRTDDMNKHLLELVNAQNRIITKLDEVIAVLKDNKRRWL